MNRLVSAAVTAAATIVGLGAPAIAGAPAPAIDAHRAGQGITVAFAQGQQLGGGPDPLDATVAVTVNVDADCSRGCELIRSREDEEGYTEQEVLDRRSFPAGQRTYTVSDRRGLEDGGWWWTEYMLRQKLPGGGAKKLFEVDSDLGLNPEAGLFDDPGWRRELDLSAVHTMILRSRTPRAVSTLSSAEHDRVLGIVAERGPNAGVLRLQAGSGPATTVDLRAARVTKRTVVANVAVPANTVLRLENATPAGRAAKTVGVDGVLYHRGAPSARRDAPRSRTPERSSDETLSIRPSVPQTLPDSRKIEVELTAEVYGCPNTCEIVRRDGSDEHVLLRKTSPRSTTLQTLTVSTTIPIRGERSEYPEYVLTKGGDDIANTFEDANGTEEDELTYSYGWTRDLMPSATGWYIMRSPTRGTGATYRMEGTFYGRTVAVVAARGPRNGVMKVYNDAVLVKTIDLYAAKWQPRQVVAVFDTKLNGRVTIANATPAGRANSDVHVDALVDFNGAYDCSRCRTGR